MNYFQGLKIRGLYPSLFIAALGVVSTANAVDPPDFVNDFPAGLACAFDLHVEGFGGNQHYRGFTDKDGNVVRSVLAGKGSTLVFSNPSTQATLTLKGNGAVQHSSYNSDGTSTQVTTGHVVVILFPTDFPPGPSTTLYVGRTLITIDAFGNWTLQSDSGTSTDICAALS